MIGQVVYNGLVMFTPDQYQLIDFGDARRLERFGPLLLDRPCPSAEGFTPADPEAWGKADARFHRAEQGEGHWTNNGELPPTWAISHGQIRLELKCTAVGHLGLFPEQAENWDWIARQVAAAARPPNVLNLFAYTGGSSLAAAAAGAEVLHLDAAKNTVAWARHNAQLSQMTDLPIRWIAEDARKFLRRELKRENRYDAIILDPPSYGPGTRGEAWRLSENLGTMDGTVEYIGTRYHFADTYRVMMDSGLIKPRIHKPRDANGRPVLMTAEKLAEKRQIMGPYVYSCQMELDPVADSVQGFKREWIKYHNGPSGDGMNKYILVDPANEKKKSSDYTAIFVVGLNADHNYYVLDIVRDRLNLTERANAIFDLHRDWKPIAVGYEKYGKDSDIQHLEERMGRENYRFTIYSLGGPLSKPDRIRELIPLFETGRIWFPDCLYYDDYEGRKTDLVKDFIEQEYLGFPVAIHDDMLDCLARIIDKDMPTFWPSGYAPEKKGDRYDRAARRQRRAGSWMAA